MRTTRSNRTGTGSIHILASRAVRVLLVASVAAGCARTAAAQEYRADKVDPQAKRNAGIVLSVVRTPARFAQDKAQVMEYFTGYYFPDMTQAGADDLARLGDARYNLFRKYLWATENEQLQQDLTELAFNAARRIVVASDPPYHPAVRYNAILILGQLDKQYAIEVGANRRPPVPLPQATEFLTTVVTLAADDKPVPPAVTLGALIGLERHAQYRDALAPGAAEAMTAALLKLVNHEKPILDMDRQSFAWLRLQAAGVLAQLGSVGPNNEVHDALVKLVGELRSLDDRTAAAALLSRINYEGAKVEGAAAVEQLFELARELGAAESKRAEDFQNARIGGGAGFSPRGPRGGEFAFGAQAGGATYPRRQVLARLTDLRAALRAVKPVVAEDVQKKVDAVLAAMQPVIKDAADKEVIELNVAAAIHRMAAAIDRETAPPDEPAGEGAGDIF